jgi:hypothetical protein
LAYTPRAYKTGGHNRTFTPCGNRNHFALLAHRFVHHSHHSDLTEPKEARHAGIDLIDQRQILVPLGVLNLVHPDGVDLSEYPVLLFPGYGTTPDGWLRSFSAG